MTMLNVVSLPKHLDEICLLLADQSIDVLALNETRLHPDISDGQVHITRYDIIHSDGNRIYTLGVLYLTVIERS